MRAAAQNTNTGLPLVAMTREMGSLGKDVAEGLARRTGRRVVYHEIIEPIANKMRLRKSHVERFLDGRAGIWERLTTDKTSLSIYTADETFRFVRDGSTGVIRGWGAVHLLKDVPHVIRVRVCAPMELRIERMMQRLATDDRQTVQSEIEMSEEAHTAITRRHFGVDWRNPENYDLVLCTERLSVDECVDEVEALLHKETFQETPHSVRVFENLALEWRVRSALRRDPRTARANLDVLCDAGRVRIGGPFDMADAIAAAVEIAAKLDGVYAVESELGHRGSEA